MKLPQINKDGSRLHILIYSEVYAMPVYVDFDSVEELTDYVKNEFGASRSQFEYYYTKRI